MSFFIRVPYNLTTSALITPYSRKLVHCCITFHPVIALFLAPWFICTPSPFHCQQCLIQYHQAASCVDEDSMWITRWTWITMTGRCCFYWFVSFAGRHPSVRYSVTARYPIHCLSRVCWRLLLFQSFIQSSYPSSLLLWTDPASSWQSMLSSRIHQHIQIIAWDLSALIHQSSSFWHLSRFQ